MRAAMSTAPPGPKGMMMLTGLSGYAARAMPGESGSKRAQVVSAARKRRISVIIMVSFVAG